MQEPNERSAELAKLLEAIAAGEQVIDFRDGGVKFRQLNWGADSITPEMASKITVVITDENGVQTEESLITAIQRIDEKQDLRPVNYSIKMNELDAEADIRALRVEIEGDKAYDGDLEEPVSAGSEYTAKDFTPSYSYFVAGVNEEPGTAPLYSVKGGYVFDAENVTLKINGVDVHEANANVATSPLGYGAYINGADQMELLAGDEAEVAGLGFPVDAAIKQIKTHVATAEEEKTSYTADKAKADEDEAAAIAAFEAKEAELGAQIDEGKAKLEAAKADRAEAIDGMANADTENELKAFYDDAKKSSDAVEKEQFNLINLNRELDARQAARAAAKKAHDAFSTLMSDNITSAEENIESLKESLEAWEGTFEGGKEA